MDKQPARVRNIHQTDRLANRQRQTDRGRGTERDRDRDTDRHTDRHTD